MTENEWIEHESAQSDYLTYSPRSKDKFSYKRCDDVMIGAPLKMKIN